MSSLYITETDIRAYDKEMDLNLQFLTLKIYYARKGSKWLLRFDSMDFLRLSDTPTRRPTLLGTPRYIYVLWYSRK